MREVKIRFSPEIVLFAIFIFVNCFYPVWYYPPLLLCKFISLNVLLLASSVFLFSEIFSGLSFNYKSRGKNSGRKDEMLVIIVLIAVIALHCKFWKLPVMTGGDIQSLISPPAYFLNKVCQMFKCYWIQPALLWVFLLAGVIIMRKRMFEIHAIFEKKQKIALYLAVFVIVNFYGVILYKLNIIERVGMPATILRFPPVSKFLYLFSYLIFGINEFGPRLMQFLFLILTAIYIMKLIGIQYSVIPRKYIFPIVLLFPPFFHFSNTAYLTCGTLFFFISVSYYFIKSISDKHLNNLFCFAGLLMLGLMYRRLIVGIVPAIGLYLIWLFFKKMISAGEFIRYFKILALVCLTAAPLYVAGMLVEVRTSALAIKKIMDCGIILSGINGLLKTNGLILNFIIFFSLAGTFFFKPKQIAFGYWLILSIVYYLWISSSGGAMYYIRYFQPFYLIVIIFFVNFIVTVYNSRLYYGKKIARTITLIFCFAALYQNFFSVKSFQRKNFTNMYENIYPYDSLMAYLKNIKQDKLKIYAPMEAEPSHFYIAKYKLASRVLWDRTSSADINRETIVNKAAGYDYLCLVETDEYRNVIRGILKIAIPEKVFDFKGNRIYLFRKNKDWVFNKM